MILHSLLQLRFLVVYFHSYPLISCSHRIFFSSKFKILREEAALKIIKSCWSRCVGQEYRKFARMKVINNILRTQSIDHTWLKSHLTELSRVSSILWCNWSYPSLLIEIVIGLLDQLIDQDVRFISWLRIWKCCFPEL